MLKAILFDLDGTLLPMNEEEFTKGYFKLLCKKWQIMATIQMTLLKLYGLEQKR